MFDKKIKRGIIHHARQRRTESACRFEFEIHHFIYFPTPLYTKTRCQAGFCVCWGFFLFEKSSGRQCTRPIEQLLSAATPPVKMQARKVRRLSGLVLSQNIIPLMDSRSTAEAIWIVYADQTRYPSKQCRSSVLTMPSRYSPSSRYSSTCTLPRSRMGAARPSLS